MKKKHLHQTLLVALLSLSACNVSADDARVYQQDSTGNIQYHKPSAVIQKDGRIIQTDSVGNKQHHKQQYQIKDGKVYQTYPLGNIQHHKPRGVIKK